MNESTKRTSAGVVCGGFSARDCATSRLASRAAIGDPRVSKPYLSHASALPSLSPFSQVGPATSGRASAHGARAGSARRPRCSSG